MASAVTVTSVKTRMLSVSSTNVSASPDIRSDTDAVVISYYQFQL